MPKASKIIPRDDRQARKREPKLKKKFRKHVMGTGRLLLEGGHNEQA
jgi:hypothetical protein